MVAAPMACAEGFGFPEFREAQARLRTLGPEAFLQSLLAKRFADVDEWQTEMQLKSMRVGQVKLYTTGLDAEERSLTCVDVVASVDAALADALATSADGSLAVIPEGPYVVPVEYLTARNCRTPQRSRSISISWAASPATCSWRRSADALPALQPRILDAIAAVGPDSAAMPEFAATTQAGLRACRFGVATAYRAAPDTAGAAYTALRDRIRDATLDAGTRKHALAFLALLGDAEAKVHGTSLENVHFHELADWDSLMDVVAAGSIAASSTTRVDRAAPPLGGGRVEIAHGALPVPAPATCALLEGYPWRDDGIDGERVTPTGAAIVRHLVSTGAARPHTTGGLLGVGPARARARWAERRTSCARCCSSPTTEIACRRRRRLRDDVRVRRRRHDRRGDRVCGRPAASSFRRPRRVDGHALRQEGTPAAISACSWTRPPRRRDACVLHGDVHPRRARARGAPARAAPPGRRAESAYVTVKVAERPGGARTGKAAHDDVAQSDPQARRTSAPPRGARAEGRAVNGEPSPRLAAALDRHARLAIAVSGGVDSMTLAHVAARTPAPPAVMYHAASPAVPVRRANGSKRTPRARMAARGGRRPQELADARYRANPVDRCYYCKTNLYDRIAGATPDTIASGTNRDDLVGFPSRLESGEGARRRPSVRRGRRDQARHLRDRAVARLERSCAPACAALPCKPGRDGHRHRPARPRIRRRRGDGASQRRSAARRPCDAA